MLNPSPRLFSQNSLPPDPPRQVRQAPTPSPQVQQASTRPEAVPAAHDADGSIVAIWAIQLGAFADSNNAVRLCKSLKAKGLDPVTYPNLIDGKHLLHLVWVGRYDNPQEAIPEIARIESLTGIRGVLREQQVWRKKNTAPAVRPGN